MLPVVVFPWYAPSFLDLTTLPPPPATTWTKQKLYSANEAGNGGHGWLVLRWRPRLCQREREGGTRSLSKWDRFTAMMISLPAGHHKPVMLSLKVRRPACRPSRKRRSVLWCGGDEIRNICRHTNACTCMHSSLCLFTPGINMCLGCTDHKWTDLSTSVHTWH